MYAPEKMPNSTEKAMATASVVAGTHMATMRMPAM
jgi:hypothetical protein